MSRWQGAQAIETEYGGHRFRSRLEARWAVFFDTLGVAYEYEPEGFELPSGRYLPDFWLPRQECWVEIKGPLPSPYEKQLASELAEATNCLAHIFWGQVAPDPCFSSDNEGEWHGGGTWGGSTTCPPQRCQCGSLVKGGWVYNSAWRPCYWCENYFIRDDLWIPCRCNTTAECCRPPSGYSGPIIPTGRGVKEPRLIRAYAAARQARFST